MLKDIKIGIVFFDAIETMTLITIVSVLVSFICGLIIGYCL